jgi:RimJ/RimL family protein N-acetyltransferase
MANARFWFSVQGQDVIELQRFTEDDCRRLIDWIPDAQFLPQWAGPNYSWPLNVEQIQETLVGANAEGPTHYMFKAMVAGSRRPLGILS